MNTRPDKAVRRTARPASVVWRRPEALLAATFALLIVAGTLLLLLPAAQGDTRVGIVDCLFTATSAVCVTGLISVDTATAWSRFGQTVILVLIQLGGLGIMTFGALAARLLHLRLSFTSQVAWQNAFFEQSTRADVRRALGRIVLMTLVIEAAGMALLQRELQSGPAPRGGVFEAVFLAVSAFCNAGFSVYSDSVAGLRDSRSILATLMVLIVLGGLGYATLSEVLGRAWDRLRGRRGWPLVWSLQTRLVLWMSLVLIVGGAVCILLAGLTPGEHSLGEQALHALFQSVSARTAGFNTVDVGMLPMASRLILILLMFIGGSPGSCAGGIKTTTAAVWVARVRSRLLGLEAVTIAGRRIPHNIVRRAALLLSVAVLWNAAGALLLAVTEGRRPGACLEHLLFEQISAFGTVGLSAGVTATLSTIGKLWIAATMFVGRLGPLTVAFAVLAQRRVVYGYPDERVMIG